MPKDGEPREGASGCAVRHWGGKHVADVQMKPVGVAFQ